MVLLLVLLELEALLEDAARSHEAHIPHNDLHQKLAVSDKSMAVASSNKEPEARGPQSEDAVECQEVQQKLFRTVQWRFQRSKLVDDTCQRTAARVA